MNNTISAFPFELAIKNGPKRPELFIETVEQILNENLQSEKTFGCHIQNCHMHIGSKIHTNEFVEAELLFHNSYYNSHFAWLTKRLIKYQITHNESESIEPSSIIIVGYEIFGELYLLDCVSMLEKEVNCPVYYCVAEGSGGKVKIRSTIPVNEEGCDKKPYYVFIVPISTTLTTHDKLMHEYLSYLKKRISDNEKCVPDDIHITFEDLNYTNLALIVIGPEENDYWKEYVEDTEFGKLRYLQLNEEKQKYLNVLKARKVFYFARQRLDWKSPKRCSRCYPDRKKRVLTDETPVFEVSKEAIVPVLQIGIDGVPAPLNTETNEKNTIYQQANLNIEKVIDLSSFMYAKHIVRNGNHYQYYINSQAYIEHLEDEPHRSRLSAWEDKINYDLFEDEKSKYEEFTFYDFLVAPRHFSNAGFVHEVNERVFHNSARVLYIDVNKEYRNNLVAKYSDFSAQVQKIAGSRQKYKIRFHYVDDMIITGSSFYRSKSLVNSLIGELNRDNDEDVVFKTLYDEENENKNSTDLKSSINLFSSIIVLADRNSYESRKNYINKPERFYSYVYVSISSLRNQEHSCVLCNVRKSFKILRKQAALKETANRYKRNYQRYNITDCQELESKEYADHSARLLMIIGHILEERLTNKWFYKEKIYKSSAKEDEENDYEIGAVNIENTAQILKVLNLYYEYLYTFIGAYPGTSFKREDVEIATIKIISRPFFTNHIRRRQASFKFCINKLAEFQKLSKEQRDSKTSHIKTLINALSDMNANYLFRRENMVDFLDISSLQKDYIWAVKKEISLSNDDNKSVLLEHSLVKGNEDWLFNDKPVIGSLKKAPNAITHQKSWMELYFENNSVLKSSLIKAIQLESLEQNEYPYYLNSFIELMKVQGIGEGNFSLLKEYVKAFKNLYGAIENREKGIDDIEKFAECIINLLCSDSAHQYNATYVFLKDKKQVDVDINRWNRYAILAKNEKGSDIDFYNSRNLRILDALTGEKNEKIIAVMDTIFFFKNEGTKSGKKQVDSTVINLFEDKNVCLYVQIEKSIGDATLTRGAIKDNTLHFLLPLKILLCIRYETSKYLKKCNLLSYLQGKKFKDITTALTIRKASKHQALEVNEGNFGHHIMYAIYKEAKHYQTGDLNSVTTAAEKKFCDGSFKFPKSFTEAYEQIAAKYMQYLANEYISSFYKEMVKESLYNEKKKSGNGIVLRLAKTRLDVVLDYFLKMGFERSPEGTEISSTMFVPNRKSKQVRRMVGDQEIKITIHTEGFVNDRVIWTRNSGHLTEHYYLLILSLSMNAGKHFFQDTESDPVCYVDVMIDRDYLVVRNNMSEKVFDNNPYNLSEVIKRMMTPPWFFERNEQSITFWTIHTFMEIFQNKEEIIDSILKNEKKSNTISQSEEDIDLEWICPDIGINKHDGKRYFEVRLKLIGDDN